MTRLFLALSLLLAAPAMAAEPPAAETPAARTPDPAAVAAAERLLDAMQYASLVNRTVDAMVADQTKATFARIEQRIGKPLDPALKTRMGDAMEASIRHMFAESLPALRKGTALIYARYFTAEELDRYIVLQRDPAMVKMLSVTPQILAETSQLSQAMVEREMPRLTAELAAILQDHLKTSKD
jgi:hypothetical protein